MNKNKIDIYSIGQYSDSEYYYIQRLKEIDQNHSISYVIVMDSIKTKGEAKAWLKSYSKAFRTGEQPE